MGHTAQEIWNAKMCIGFNKFWLPNRVGSGTGTKRTVIDRSNYFPVVAWGTSIAVITNCVISAVLTHKKEFRQFKTTTNNNRNSIFPPINKRIYSFQQSSLNVTTHWSAFSEWRNILCKNKQIASIFSVM